MELYFPRESVFYPIKSFNFLPVFRSLLDQARVKEMVNEFAK